MGLDKKVEQGRLRLVLLERIGTAFVTADFPQDALESVLEVPLLQRRPRARASSLKSNGLLAMQLAHATCDVPQR